jgi:hypothetical protein
MRTQAHRWRRAGEVQEISRFLKSLTQRRQVSIERDEIEEVTVLAGGGIAPFADPLAGEMHIEAPTRGVGDIADMPIPSGAATVGEIVTTHGFCVLGKKPHNFCNGRSTVHHA